MRLLFLKVVAHKVGFFVQEVVVELYPAQLKTTYLQPKLKLPCLHVQTPRIKGLTIPHLKQHEGSLFLAVSSRQRR